MPFHEKKFQKKLQNLLLLSSLLFTCLLLHYTPITSSEMNKYFLNIAHLNHH